MIGWLGGCLGEIIHLDLFWKISFYELFRHVMYLKLNICIRCIYHYMILHDYIYIFIVFLQNEWDFMVV